MSEYSLMFASLGSGITVANRNVEENGDYQRIAHIGANRGIAWRHNKLPTAVVREVLEYALTADPSVSTSQPEQKVFTNRPAGKAR